MYMPEISERSPSHLFLYLVLIRKQKCGNKLMALPVLRTRELRIFIETKIYSHRDTYSRKAELRLHQHEYVGQH